MDMVLPGSTTFVDEALPFGDVTLAPTEATGMSEVELARSMAEHLLASSPHSDSAALMLLRRAFPGSPLTVRVAALAALIRR